MILLSFNTRSQNKRLIKTLGDHPVIKGVCVNVALSDPVSV